MTRENTAPQYDGAYRKLFEQELMVQQLIEVFVGQNVAALLDFDKMKQLPITHHSETLVRRENDILWEIPTRSGEPLYIVLMLEFQSSPDPLMAHRIMTYLSLCHDELIKKRGWSSERGLPPPLPIVLYNGAKARTSKTNIRDLFLLDANSPLATYQPHLEYCLINVGDYSKSELFENEDLVSTLFLLEQATDIEQIYEVLEDLIERTMGESLDAIRRGFLAWIGKVLYRKMEISLPPAQLDSLTEFKDMLTENLDKWVAKQVEQRAKESLEQGRKQGLEQGRAQGIELGAKQQSREAVSRLLAAKFGDNDERDALLDAYSSDALMNALPLILDLASEDAFWTALGEPSES